MVAHIQKFKIDLIRTHFIKGGADIRLFAPGIGLSIGTVVKYRREFRQIQRLYPDKLVNYKFRLKKKKTLYPEDVRKAELLVLLPQLMENSTCQQITMISLWRDYRALQPGGYGLSAFTLYYDAWRKKNNACAFSHRRIKYIYPGDMKVLTHWKNGDSRDLWRKALVILGSFNGRNVREMALQIEYSVRSVLRWIDHYKAKRLDGLVFKPAGINERIVNRNKQKAENLVRILHESPGLHGYNRTSWRLEDLSATYLRVYREPMAPTTIAVYLKRLGFGFRKSRETLTSPDPNFREKLDHIKNILATLGEHERFFSVDEYGHFAVKIKGGRTITRANEPRIVPANQRSKGFMVVTAALELSSNQVTHFYSRKKDTEEMIKLLEILLQQYRAQNKLYFSWDAASWHASKLLYKKLEEVNSESYRAQHGTPLVELAPLPASAQFLNVIESVFSGLAKAVIHNSDYDSVGSCMAAIDRHFSERNAHFLAHPKKAGNMIWGRERVKPVFLDTNNCKYNNI